MLRNHTGTPRAVLLLLLLLLGSWGLTHHGTSGYQPQHAKLLQRLKLCHDDRTPGLTI